MLPLNLPIGQKNGEPFLKNMACSEGDELLGDDFHAFLVKVEADMFQIIKKCN